MDVKQIKERLAAATPGPWVNDLDDARLIYYRRVPEAVKGLGLIAASTVPADGDFIANAPTDIAYLLAENERLEAENEAMRMVVKAAEPIALTSSDTWGMGQLKAAIDNLKAAK